MPRGFTLQIFRPAFSGDHKGDPGRGGGGPSQIPLAPPLQTPRLPFSHIPVSDHHITRLRTGVWGWARAAHGAPAPPPPVQHWDCGEQDPPPLSFRPHTEPQHLPTEPRIAPPTATAHRPPQPPPPPPRTPPYPDGGGSGGGGPASVRPPPRVRRAPSRQCHGPLRWGRCGLRRHRDRAGGLGHAVHALCSGGGGGGRLPRAAAGAQAQGFGGGASGVRGLPDRLWGPDGQRVTYPRHPPFTQTPMRRRGSCTRVHPNGRRPEEDPPPPRPKRPSWEQTKFAIGKIRSGHFGTQTFEPPAPPEGVAMRGGGAPPASGGGSDARQHRGPGPQQVPLVAHRAAARGRVSAAGPSSSHPSAVSLHDTPPPPVQGAPYGTSFFC